MLERALVPLLTLQHFDVIAEQGSLKGLPLLSSACVRFAQQNVSALDAMAEKGELSPAVISLIGHLVSPTGRPAGSTKRPRRSF